MKRLQTLYPYLLAVYPVLALYNINIDQLTPAELILPLTIALAITFILSNIALMHLKDREKSALVLSVFWALFFSYGYVFDWITAKGISDNIVRQNELCLAALYFLLFIAFYYAAHKSRRWIHAASILASSVSWILILSVLSCLGLQALNFLPPIKAAKGQIGHAGTSIHGQSSRIGYSPDIYYLVIDEYAGQEQIKNVYSYDNSPFVKFLTEKGFIVTKKSRVRTSQTAYSLAGSLNMRHPGQNDNPYEMIRTNQVARELRSRGYIYIHFGSWWSATAANNNADINRNDHLLGSEFTGLLARGSFFRRLLNSEMFARSRTSGAFDEIAKIPEMKTDQPKFIFAHIISPHAPFVFGSNGEEIGAADKNDYSNRALYLGQYIYITKRTEDLVNKILQRSEKPPVIVIQSDHGVRVHPGIGINSGYEHRIFNAYYLPGEKKPQVWNSISPVNTFRMIFNYYFRTKYRFVDDA